MWAHPATLGFFGLFIGFIGSLVGVGGGFMMIPYFSLVLRWPHMTAVGTSLGVIVANASSGVVGFARQRRIDFLVGTVLGVATLPGTWLGKLVGQGITNDAFRIAFGVVIIAAACMTVAFRAEGRPGLAWFRRGAHRHFQDRAGETYDYSINLWSAGIISVGMGFLSSLFGVGGGFIHVPLLILLYGVPPHVAMATSHYILVMTAAAGTIEYALGGYLTDEALKDEPLKGLFWMGLGAFLGAQLGVALSAKLHGRTLKWVLAVVLLAVSALMIFTGLRR